MGRDKAWLPAGAVSLVQRQIEVVRAAGAGAVFLSGRVGADYGCVGVPVLLDPSPDLGPLAGIERGLEACGPGLLLVLAVDLPAIRADLLRAMRRACRGDRGVVARLHDRWEPLAAIYPKESLEVVREQLRRGHRAAHEFAERCRTLGLIDAFSVPPERAGDFLNWNRPEDFPAGGTPAD